MSRWKGMAKGLMTLVAGMALALQLVLPMPQPAAASTETTVICHSEPAAPHHGGKHGAPSGQAGCDWCMLCGKLGTAVGPLDRVASVPQRVEAPVAVFVVTAEPGHSISWARTGPLGARAPPGIA